VLRERRIIFKAKSKKLLNKESIKMIRKLHCATLGAASFSFHLPQQNLLIALITKILQQKFIETLINRVIRCTVQRGSKEFHE